MVFFVASPGLLHPRVILPRHYAIWSRGLRSRLLSTKAAVQQQSHGDVETKSVPTLLPRPFAIEHVDGRARHLTWTETGEVKREWRDITSHGAEPAQRAPRLGKITAWLRQMFLPTNYPQSVHRSYLPYHSLQFAETIVGTVVSVLCNQALLVSVGVSAEGSIFGAVAVQWIIKDGAGEVAKLFFIRRFSPYFDSHPKTFNLLGSAGVLLGSGLQLAALVTPPTTGYFLTCAAGGNIFKLIGNAIWFTTHIKFVRFFSLQGNMGDVAAKSESQSSVGQLLGYAAGIGLLTFSHSAGYLYSIFAVSVPLHMIVTGWMLKVASFEMLTLPRASWLASEYVAASPATAPNPSCGVVTLTELDATKQTGFFGEFYKSRKNNYLRLAPRMEDVLESSTSGDRQEWEICVNAFDHERYLLYPSQSRRRSISIFYNPQADSDDILRSILHASALRRMLINQEFFVHLPSHISDLDERNSQRKMEILRKSLYRSNLWMATHFKQFKAELKEHGWRTDDVAFADHGRRVLWGSAAATS
ncbi:vitamin B6 photo-protection and homoeostasis-domain-containing protein [Irpex rosettiformis]|uniref:Vitamin B6 photo-protection and homoeostasis-domain-containing protein n=1 Tax=Irpex rosettiformis TaxID=378272 RepID=A0ACB8UA76_9APHY|nr:vitamin B6 photo-protection and homoeostasis-domain-containing protein [Irpex rosettiformis]